MRISGDAIEFLVELVTGNSGISTYRSGPELVNYFNSLGADDLYGSGFPSRHVYVREKLNEWNGTELIKKVVEGAPIVSDDEALCEDIAFQLNRKIAQSGFKLKKDYLLGFTQGNEYFPGPIFFDVVPNTLLTSGVPEFLLTEASMNESLGKARDRLERGDFSGSISICYTLVEEFLKLKLKELPDDFNENEGDIKKLYRAYTKQSGLSVEKDTTEALKPLLSGLTTLVGGFYEIANKAGDRHQKKFSPSAHHARLVVNLTLAFCEFLIASGKSREQIPS